LEKGFWTMENVLYTGSKIFGKSRNFPMWESEYEIKSLALSGKSLKKKKCG
jgi:hypothetical protein